MIQTALWMCRRFLNSDIFACTMPHAAVHTVGVLRGLIIVESLIVKFIYLTNLGNQVTDGIHRSARICVHVFNIPC